MLTLITGAAGFVGTVLHQHLTSCGDDVIASDRASGGPNLVDRSAVDRHLKDARPDVIYHLAAQSHVPTAWDDPVGTLRTNVEGTQNVLDAARNHGVRRVLVVSSSEIYGLVDASELPLNEDQPQRPTNPYAASKVAADAVAMAAHLGSGQDVIRLRAFNHIGPGQRDDFVAAALAKRIVAAERNGEHELPVGNLTPRRDFTDVRDVVRAYRLVAEHGEPGAAYNVCSGVDRSIGELAQTMIDLAQADLTLLPDPDLQRASDNPVLRGDHGRITAATGWEPQIPFEQSLADILTDARERVA